ncbi:MAG: TauD/TfdA family dioxygenase [Chloroflexi bacterium]|nr:TauD/TfdA family dioxygenase [Chloroflexota bacterium]MCI0580053.1 TauD/TfdA family dioxygenase [Chloroflexota bacterium]MCI0649768.1 TauD/TfdA family dioxygenase [Chloroflexota bacterium]MCI0731615.1 TauD/TfdA family dioxygenase [Chloroflexota bacterium]
MSTPVIGKPDLTKLRSSDRRKAIRVSENSLARIEPLYPESPLPLLISPVVDGLELSTWAAGNRDFLESHLLKHGGLLFRGFQAGSLAEFQRFVEVFSAELLEYTYGFTPRKQVEGKIYTSTEYPADQFIPYHNEKSYATSWPMKIWFFCVQAAQRGGETPIVDSRKVFEGLDPAIRQRFAEKKVRYMRNYSPRLDLPWQNVFQTSERSEVEAYCREAGISYQWKDGDGLRTYQVCQAVATHPKTGQQVWFNQAHLFHVTSLPETIRQVLLAEFEEEELPRNVTYGDGSPIEADVLEEIRRVYREEAVAFPWQEGDVLMLDNMLVAHARNPFEGPRKIVVAMSEAFNG